MDIKCLEALGNSINPEDYAGDFARARDIAERNLRQARNGGAPETVAGALLDRGVVHLLQGELSSAFACLDEVEKLVPEDAIRVLRVLSYRLLAIYEEFNTFPDNSGAAATEITARWQGAPDIQPLDTRWRQLMAQANEPEVQYEAWFVYGFLCNLKPARYTLEAMRFSPSPVSRQQMLETLLQPSNQLRKMGEAGALPSVMGAADLSAADLKRRGGELSAGRQTLERALSAYQQAGDSGGAARCVLMKADWLAAPFSSPLVWNFALQDSSSEGSHLAATLESDEFQRPSESALSEAGKLYEDVEGFIRQGYSPRGMAAVNLRYGYLAALREDYEEATRLTSVARHGFEQSGDWRGYWPAQTHWLMAQIGAGRHASLDHLARAIGAWGANTGSFSFTLGLGILLNRWARHWLIRRGDYERALAGYRAAQSLFESLGAGVNAAQNLVDQGVTYQAVGERVAAVTFFEQALDAYTKEMNAHPRIGDNLRQRLIMLTTSVYQLYLQQMNGEGMERSAARLKALISVLPGGQGDTGELMMKLAEQVQESLSNAGVAGSAEMPAGIEFWSLRQMAQSIIEQSSVLAPLYRSRQAKEAGNVKEAEKCWQEAQTALSGVAGELRDFLSVVVLAEKERFDEAAAAFRRHLEQGGANAGFVGELTKVMAAVGGGQGEREAQLQARRTHEHALSVFVRVKKYDEARQHLEALERLAGKQWWADDVRPWQSLSECAEMYEGLGEFSAALDCYKQAIAQLEAHRGQLSRDELKTAIASDKGAQYLYFLAARAAIKQGNAARAFEYAERGKARALLDLIAGSAFLAREPKKESEAMREWRQLSAQLTLWRGLLGRERMQNSPDASRIEQLTKEVAAGEARLRQVEAGLARSNPDFLRTVSGAAEPLSLGQVAERLPPDAALIEYFFLGGDLLAWAITRDGLIDTQHRPIEAAKLAREIGKFHQACAENRPVETLSEFLTEAFLTPFASVIRNAGRLIIVPHGAAHKLPFQALLFEGQPLAASCSVSYLPSASVLQFAHTQHDWRAPETILAVGNPTGDLRHAEAEAALVADLFHQTPLLGREATEAAVRERLAEYPSILHFATHGNLYEDSPLQSSISLANGDELTVYELMGLQLKADLVVLSACNTARGETTGGDDVLGLTRGLLGAGARAAVVSLWPADDLSTSLFMGEFYRRLQDGAPPAAALQTAQNYLRNLDQSAIEMELERLRTSLRKLDSEGAVSFNTRRGVRFGKQANAPSKSADDYRHPYYWAPFVLVGVAD